MDADPHHGEASHGMQQFEQKEQDQLHQQSISSSYDLKSCPIDEYMRKYIKKIIS